MEEQYLSHKAKLSIGIFLVTTLTIMGAGCSLWNPPTPLPETNNQAAKTPPVINDGTLAQALLTSDSDVKDISGMEDARPQPLELNHHLDDTIPGSYNFYVARSWYDRPSSNILMQNAVTQFADAKTAQTAITEQAKSYTTIKQAESIGDSSVAYYVTPTAEDKAALVYRFTVDVYAAKVQVFSTTDTVLSDLDLQTAMLPVATNLAIVQADKLQAFLSDNYTIPTPTTAMNRLPTSLTSTTYIGQVPMTDQEWLGVSFDMKRDNLTGYKTGGISRFEMKNKPGEVVEVVVMEFDTPNNAKTFQAELTSGVDGKTTTNIDVPTDLGVDQTSAIHRAGLVELQAVQDNNVIDVSIFAPFANDDEPSKDDLLAISKEVLEEF